MARKPGIGLAVSGGGFRATLFHLGAFIRLNELGVLRRTTEITSVSGGSIIAGFLGCKWNDLDFDADGRARNFQDVVVAPLRAFTARTVDRTTIFFGWVTPFQRPGDFLKRAYDKHLFGGADLKALPEETAGPKFTIYATNLETGSSVRISRDEIADYKLGRIPDPDLTLAEAVTASSAFPPVYVPFIKKYKPADWRGKPDTGRYAIGTKSHRRLLLGDGGIYDNLALERVWDTYETVLVSDAGAPFSMQPNAFLLRNSMVARTKRTLDIAVEQTRALRKRKLVGDLIDGVMKGVYWGISTEIAHYELAENGLGDPLLRDTAATAAIGTMRTRLNRFKPDEQERLINWGYALAETALLRHVDNTLPRGTLPFPDREM